MKHARFAKNFSFLLLLLLLPALLLGCGTNAAVTEATEAAEAAEATGPEQLLVFTAKTGFDIRTQIFNQGDPWESYPKNIVYDDVTDVTVEINGEQMDFVDAINSGALTHEDIFCMARKDAKNGFCEEAVTSNKGLATYRYIYPEVAILLCQDALELPSGDIRLYSDLRLTAPKVAKDRCFGPGLVAPGGPGDVADKEDWGLELSLTDITPTGLTVQCTQSGGQQFGELQAYYYHVYNYATDELNTCLEPIGQMLTMGGTSSVVIDWSENENMGQLAPGKYMFRISFQDVFDPESLHPFTHDFRDRQIYDIDFTIE